MAKVSNESFQMVAELPAKHLVTTVDRLLRQADCQLCGLAAYAPDAEANGARIELHPPRERQHLWSPALTVQLFSHSEGTRLDGRFGPGPSLFSLYVAISAISVFASLVGLAFAYAQWMLGVSPTGLWALPCALLPVVGAFLTQLAGRSVGREQMAELRRFLERAVECAKGESSLDAGLS